MDHRHVVRSSSAIHFRQTTRMPKSSLPMELSMARRLKYNVHVALNSTVPLPLPAQRPDNGVAQFQTALKTRLQQFAYRLPLCQQQLSLELGHRSRRGRHRLPCEQAADSPPQQQQQQPRNQFQQSQRFRLIWIRKKIKMIATCFLAQFVRNTREEDQWSRYQRITINHHRQQPLQRPAKWKQQRKIFRKKLTPHIQGTMKWLERTTMCK